MRKNEPEDMGGCEIEQPAGWYCTRDFHHNGPCATKRLPAAPSVEQDERAALLADHIELNMSNYDQDDVDRLNDWAIRAYDFIVRHLATINKKEV